MDRRAIEHRAHPRLPGRRGTEHRLGLARAARQAGRAHERVDWPDLGPVRPVRWLGRPAAGTVGRAYHRSRCRSPSQLRGPGREGGHPRAAGRWRLRLHRAGRPERRRHRRDRRDPRHRGARHALHGPALDRRHPRRGQRPSLRRPRPDPLPRRADAGCIGLRAAAHRGARQHEGADRRAGERGLGHRSRAGCRGSSPAPRRSPA